MDAASDDWHTTTATVDLRVGGVFSSRMEAKDGQTGFDFTGTYTNIVKHELIAYSFDAETTYPVAQQRDGWQAILNNFKRHVEAS